LIGRGKRITVRGWFRESIEQYLKNKLKAKGIGAR
jgi:hypothetical protein